MKNRRWLVIALALLTAALLTAAQAEDTVSLEEIGIRYTPAEGETCLTRGDMPADALSALGTDTETLLSSMERDDLYLISLMPDGRQVSLEVTAKPVGIASSDYYQMTVDEKSVFLTRLARKGGYGGAFWQADGYALFSSTAESQGLGTLSYADLSLSTLYLDRVYTFRMDLIGRQAEQADTDLLLSAAGRAMRLGARAQTEAEEAEEPAVEPLALPSTEVESQAASFTYQSRDCPLTLDPVPAVVGVTNITLSGVTVPGAHMRYSVNGSTSSRVKADEDGAFSVTVPSLEGNAENDVEVLVYKDALQTVVDFTVTVDWQYAPLALETPGNVEADGVTLNGLVLPGSTVVLTQWRNDSSVAVAEDGSFTVTLSLRSLGENDFSLQVRSSGYHRNDYDFSVTRVESAAKIAERMNREACDVEYEELTADPAACEGELLHLCGTADALAYAEASPRFVLVTESGERYTVLCDNLLSITQGAAVEVYGTVTATAEPESGYPVLELVMLM